MSRLEKKRKKNGVKAHGEVKEKEKKMRPPSTTDPLALENFQLSPSICRLLEEKNISTLFPIQAQTFDLILNGVDVVARAKTGSGKTLAFVLPLIQQLLQDSLYTEHRGKGPTILCLTPTRELAKQVCEECAYIGKAGNFVSCCIYGSSPYYTQEQALAHGVDIVVGTPGRTKDHINRGNLDFSHLRVQILDECDQMLQMGFVEDVEFILNSASHDRASIQTLLFSATLPHWVKSILERFCKKGYKTVDLMSADQTMSTDMVQHKCLMVERNQVPNMLVDLIHCHGNGDRTIVFVETKVECDRVAEKLATSLKAKAIHGDLQQKSRELALDGFRRGGVEVLVATDVAARGLDIPEVDLVIQTAPPKDVESYIHRAGRTGRAQRTGVCICLVQRSNEFFLKKIQQIGKVDFCWIEAPQMGDMLTIAMQKANASLKAVKFHTSEMFKETAVQMLKEWKDPTLLLASALACVTGHSQMQQESLILKLRDHVTMKLISFIESKPFRMEDAIKVVQGVCKDVQLKGIRILQDENGAVFDIHESKVQELLSAFPEDSDHKVELIMSLPSLKSFPTFSRRHHPASFRGHQSGSHRDSFSYQRKPYEHRKYY